MASLHTGEDFESFNIFFKGNRFHAALCMIYPTVYKQRLRENSESLKSRESKQT